MDQVPGGWVGRLGYCVWMHRVPLRLKRRVYVVAVRKKRTGFRSLSRQIQSLGLEVS